MSLELVKEFMIGGNVVERETSFSGIDVYRVKSNCDDEAIIYFVKGDKVVQSLKVEADCGQNMGYISGLEFKGE